MRKGSAAALLAALLAVIGAASCADGLEAELPKVSGEGFQLQGNQRQAIESPRGRFPYVVSIRAYETRQHICTGVLITNNFVLTAAHCVDPRSSFSAGSKPFVYIGAFDAHQLNSRREVVTVVNSFPHEDWDGEQRSPYNVALLELPVKFNHPVPKILADNHDPIKGTAVTALGFGAGGRTIPVGSPVFGSLKQEGVDLIDLQHCSDKSAWGLQIKKGLLCAINEFQSSSCTVDSGSPLLILDKPTAANRKLPTDDVLLGINIDGAPCGTMDKPDIFLDLNMLNGWIKKITHAGGVQQ